MFSRLRSLALAIAAASVLAAPVDARTDPSDMSIADVAAVDMVNRFLNDIRTLQGDFVQTAPDGEVTEGRFFIERPGKLRFHYAEPSHLQLISDGSWVAVQNRRLKTTEKYPLRTTPLKLILSDQVDLMEEATITDVTEQEGAISLTLEDSGAAAGGSLTLVFDPVANTLKQWIVTDVQGLDTTVSLDNIVAGESIDPDYFRIVEDTAIDMDQWGDR